MGYRFSQIFVNFGVRGVLGAGVIFLVNQILTAGGYTLMVGQNLLTFLTSGFLGIPGVCLLYGIVFFQNL